MKGKKQQEIQLTFFLTNIFKWIDDNLEYLEAHRQKSVPMLSYSIHDRSSINDYGIKWKQKEAL